MKNANKSRRTNCTFIKIEIQVVSDPLNNFQLIMEVDLLWSKCIKYVLKLCNKNKILHVRNIMKNANNSRRTNCTFIKIKILVVPDPLNIFQLIMKVGLLWLKCLKYALKLINKKTENFHVYSGIFIKKKVIKKHIYKSKINIVS